MTGQLGLHTEVVDGSDEAFAEMMHPEAVDGDAGRERVVLAGDGLSELETAAAVGEGFAVFTGKDFEESAGDDGAAILGFAADEDWRIADVGSVRDGHRPRGRAGMRQLK